MQMLKYNPSSYMIIHVLKVIEFGLEKYKDGFMVICIRYMSSEYARLRPYFYRKNICVSDGSCFSIMF